MICDSLYIGQRFSGKELECLVRNATEEKINELISCLLRYNSKDLFHNWLLFIRQLDEFINIYNELLPIDKIRFCQTPLRHDSLVNLYKWLQTFFDGDTIRRVSSLIEAYIRTALFVHVGGMQQFLNFKDIGQLLLFCQQRRLHYVTMLHLIPTYSCGKEVVENNVIEVFWGCIEFCLMPITASYHSIIQSRCLPDYEAIHTGPELKFNHKYNQLEDLFLEPQRMTEVDLLVFNPSIREKDFTKKDPYRLYSMKELDAVYTNDAIYFEKYKLADNDVYKALGGLIADVKPFFQDEYCIEIPSSSFQFLESKYKRLTLTCNSHDIYDIGNTRVAFIKFGDTYYSNYFFLIRFYINTVYQSLRHNRTYQIDSGFLFEKKVIADVKRYGFTVMENCKRLEHKEFDVVCVKGDCIYNFQCKNNYFDASSIDLNQVDVICRYHKRLAKYYDKSLTKENNREDLLKKKLGIENVKHFVVSRYPVITNNDKVISYNKFEEFLKGL